MTSRRSISLFFVLILISSLVLVSCQTGAVDLSPTPEQADPSLTASLPEPTLTPTVTPTLEPAALQVNGEVVPIWRYEGELARYQAAYPEAGPAEARAAVIDALVAETLLAQAARENGFTLSEEDLQARLEELVAAAGGEQAFEAWLAQNHFDREQFTRALRSSMEASWQRDQIAASVPEEMEQIHARQILFDRRETADQYYQRYQNVSNFSEVFENHAWQFDPLTGGDLGWFPPGYLTVPELDQALASLQAGQLTSVVETELGYHIVYVIERGLHPLSPDARLTLQRAAVEAWLQERLGQSQVEDFTG